MAADNASESASSPNQDVSIHGAFRMGGFPLLLILVFGSGYCSLIYQTVWLREFRLLFGSSTPATAAVLAVFMGGLGAGSLFFAGRSGRWGRPVRVYAYLELTIAGLAALSPVTLGFVREWYIAVGGTPTLGIVMGSIVRLLLAALVIGPPAFFMGATLPAIARAGTACGDAMRGGISLLYMINTAGATAGVILATFVLFERYGLRASLWSACLLNVVLAAIAYAVPSPKESARTESGDASENSPPPANGRDAVSGRTALLLCAVAFISGFLFFLMELVWYRLASAILGGSTYTFGILLSVALLGIAAGSACYRLVSGWIQHPMRALALSCAFMALGLIFPFALGDHLAVWTQQLRAMDSPTFAKIVWVWYLITAILVLPASLVAGFQLPLVIAALGGGERDAGRDTGWVYAANTFGAITGSLLGGFGLLPTFGAPLLWKMASFAMMVTSLVLIAHGLISARDRRSKEALLCCLLIAIGLLAASQPGPTAVWRHSGLGVGRAVFDPAVPNDLRRFRHATNRTLVWEQDGWESGVANRDVESYAFIVNGKSDGSALGDSGTQVMLGLIGAALVPSPKQVLVVGLGTGCTAGWVAALDEVEHVKVIELEETVLRFAEECSPVNRSALSNPKVSVTIGDAREHLIAGGDSYDLIVSEPSNPYRAGVATLFSRECYRSIRARLNPGGRFVQWMQAYETDARAVLSILATLHSEFEHVEIWCTLPGDLVLVAGDGAPSIGGDVLRERINGPVISEAMRVTWGTEGLEGFFSRFVANNRYTQTIAERASHLINTDDRLILEYLCARSIHSAEKPFDVLAMIEVAARAGGSRPEYLPDETDWPKLLKQRSSILTGAPTEWGPKLFGVFVDAEHGETHNLSTTQRHAGIAERWAAGRFVPVNLAEWRLLAETAVALKHADAPQILDRLDADPFSKEVYRAALAAGEEQWATAFEHLSAAMQHARTNPWVEVPVHARALQLAAQIAHAHRPVAAALFEQLRHPFPVGLNEESRRRTAIIVASACEEAVAARFAAEAHAALEPWVFWDRDMLENREWAYRKTQSAIATIAAQDLFEYLADEPKK